MFFSRGCSLLLTSNQLGWGSAAVQLCGCQSSASVAAPQSISAQPPIPFDRSSVKVTENQISNSTENSEVPNLSWRACRPERLKSNSVFTPDGHGCARMGQRLLCEWPRIKIGLAMRFGVRRGVYGGGRKRRRAARTPRRYRVRSARAVARSCAGRRL